MEAKQEETKIPQRSNALKKFQSHHPEQHQLFSSIFQSAQQTRKAVFSTPSQAEELNCEWSNMIRNQELLKFRESDQELTTNRIKKSLGKTVTWRENLLDIKSITPPSGCSSWRQTFSFQSSYSVEEGSQKSSFDSRKTSYAEVVTYSAKLVNQKSIFQSF